MIKSKKKLLLLTKQKIYQKKQKNSKDLKNKYKKFWIHHLNSNKMKWKQTQIYY